MSTIQETYDNTERAFWLHLSRVYKHRSLPLSKLNTDKEILTKENEIPDELYRYYEDQFKVQNIDMSNPYDVQIETEYLELMNKLELSSEKVEMTNVREIKQHISKMKSKKSSSFDHVSNFMIKRLSPSYISCLANCFNTWLRDHRYPDVWKLAKIVTLNKLKAGVRRCEQTRPISLLAKHSKLFEKIVLERVRHWAETNNLVPAEQSGFCPGCLLPTRVLSIYQEVRNNMVANIPTLAIYVDCQKAYDKVWHKGLLVKLNRFGIPSGLLKLLTSRLKDRCAYVEFGENKSKILYTHAGLPQGSSLSPYLFIVYYCDIVSCVDAHSSHIFADDLNVRISPPICGGIKPMIKFLEDEGTKVCNKIAQYSKKWKQPINISKTVEQIFHSQVQNPLVDVYMQGQRLELVKEFKYLGFTWINKMSLKPTVDRILENIQKTFTKLRWMKGGKRLSKDLLRRCFFAYSFPFFAWIFPLYPVLSKTQKELLLRKFRNGLRLVHRCPFARATDLFQITKEESLEEYFKKYIKKRLERIEKTDLGRSPFSNDIFYFDRVHKNKNDYLGHFFRMKRGKLMCERHQCLLLQ